MTTKQTKAFQIIILLSLLIIFSAVLGNTMMLNSDTNTENNVNIQDETEWYLKSNLISHAMGGIDMDNYTNSLEGFCIGYMKGFKTFEIDLSLTSDNKLVGIHDWAYVTQTTHEEFMNIKRMGKYSSADLESIIDLMDEYEDIYFIIDLKNTSSKEIIQMQIKEIVNTAKNTDEAILKRIIIQLYNQPMLEYVKEIYNFDNYVYTLYRSPDNDDEVVEFVKNNNIKVVACYEVRATADFVKKLKDVNTFVFVHTINDANKYKELVSKGIHGIFTDFLTHDECNL